MNFHQIVQQSVCFDRKAMLDDRLPAKSAALIPHIFSFDHNTNFAQNICILLGLAFIGHL